MLVYHILLLVLLLLLLHENTSHTTNLQTQSIHISLTVIVGARFHNTIGRSQQSGHILSVFLQDKIRQDREVSTQVITSLELRSFIYM